MASLSRAYREGWLTGHAGEPPVNPNDSSRPRALLLWEQGYKDGRQAR